MSAHLRFETGRKKKCSLFLYLSYLLIPNRLMLLLNFVQLSLPKKKGYLYYCPCVFIFDIVVKSSKLYFDIFFLYKRGERRKTKL